MGSVTPSFAGEVAFVTGAGGGMGRAICVAFARAHASVVMADVDEEGGAETERQVRAEGAEGRFVRTDVSDASDVSAAVAVATEAYGRVDVAVNAAAIESETSALHECDDAVFDRIQAVNVRGLFLSMKYELRTMLAEGSGGAIVNIASTNSFRPQHDQPAYTASKHAVIGLTRSAAYDYASSGIRINAICPGTIDTPMLRGAIERRGRNPQDVIDRLSLFGRFGRPDEIAAAALWLCSEDASFTTGHPFAVDAGYLARESRDRMPPRSYSTVVFDFGGVLISPITTLIDEVASWHGVSMVTMLEVLMGPREQSTPDHPWHRCERGEIATADMQQEVVRWAEAAGITLRGDEYDRLLCGQFDVHADVVRRIEQLRVDGFHVGLLTNSFLEFRTIIEAKLDFGLFDTVIDSSEVRCRKPEPAIYELTTSRVGAAPERIVYLDDFLANLHGARLAGWTTIHVQDVPTALADLDALLGR